MTTQAYFLVADDIMDGSTTRRGQPCWYLQPKVLCGCLWNAHLAFETLVAWGSRQGQPCSLTARCARLPA